MKRVLITGSTGFCGTYLARHLRRFKKYQLYGTYIPGGRLPTDMVPVSLDITNQAQCTRAIKKIRPDCVFHLAAQSSARYSTDRIEETYKVNVQGTLNLASAICQHAPQSRFLYTSSVHVYGRTLRSGKITHESSPLWPESHYGISKALSELACLDLYKKFGLNLVIIRAVNYFGPGQSPELVFSDWCRQIALIENKRQAPLIEVGNLSLKRDFLYIEDAVELYERLIKQGESGQIYNVSSSRSLPLMVYLKFLISNAKVPIAIEVKRNRFRSDDVPAVRISNMKVKKLGWKPRFSIQNALQKVLHDWRERIHCE